MCDTENKYNFRKMKTLDKVIEFEINKLRRREGDRL